VIGGLDFVAVPSTDAERSRAFYVDTLGLRPDDRARFEFWADGTCFGIWEPERVGREFAPQRNAHPALHVEDVPAARAELEAKGGAAAQKALASTAAVQQTLKLAGYWDGPVDGDWTPALTEALKEFQKALGVEPSGTVDAATVAALEEALADPDRPRSDSESASPSPSPTGSTSGPSTSTSTSPA